MKAISINQPWAWLIAAGWKDIENRDWQTKYRGEVLIHTGKKFDYDGWLWVTQQFPHIIIPPIEDFFKGGIIGQVEIIDCVPESTSPWFFGKYGFVLQNAKHFEKPILCKGALGFFTPDYNSKYKT